MKSVIPMTLWMATLAAITGPSASHGAERPALEATVQMAKAVAEDARRAPDERREALFTLGHAANQGNLEALNFLVANISLRVPMAKIKGDEDALKETPCQYALGILCRTNRQVPVAVLAAVEQEKSAADLAGLAFVLQQTLGRKPARALVDQELSRAAAATQGPRQRNLEAIRKRLAE